MKCLISSPLSNTLIQVDCCRSTTLFAAFFICRWCSLEHSEKSRLCLLDSSPGTFLPLSWSLHQLHCFCFCSVWKKVFLNCFSVPSFTCLVFLNLLLHAWQKQIKYEDYRAFLMGGFMPPYSSGSWTERLFVSADFTMDKAGNTNT